MHRRVASTGMVKYEPDGHAMYEQPMISRKSAQVLSHVSTADDD